MTLMSPEHLEQGLLGLYRQGATILAVVPYEWQGLEPGARVKVRYYQVVYTEAAREEDDPPSG